MRRLLFLSTIVLLSGLAGCGGGPKLTLVQGIITYKGRPLDNTDVRFIPTGSTTGEDGVGRSDDSGNFTLTTLRTRKKGILPGEYKVAISRRVMPGGKPLPPDAKQADYPEAFESMPSEYTSILQTPLLVTVPEMGGEVKIDVTAKIQGRN